MTGEELKGFVAAPAVVAGEEIQFEVFCSAGRFVDFLELAVTSQSRIDLETLVVGSDIDQQGAGGDESL